MKKNYILAGLLLGIVGYAQTGRVGINTATPQSTLDINAKTDATSTNPEGILIPRVTKEKAFKMQGTAEGTQVYINDLSVSVTFPTDATGDKVSQITEKGFYFWNGTVWVKGNSQNGGEWVYTPGTNTIDLKRSGQAKGFVNKVYYSNATGTGVNADATQYEELENGSYVMKPLVEDGKRSLLISNTQTIKANVVNTQGVTLNTKTLSDNTVHVNEASPISNFDVTAVAGSASTNSTNASPSRYLIGVSGGAFKNDNTATQYITSGNFSGQIRAGSVSGYLNGLRSESYARTSGTISNISALNGFTTLGTEQTGNVSNVFGINGGINFYNNNATTVDTASGLSYITSLFPGANPTIANLYGLRYVGINRQSGATGTIGRHVGLQIENIDGAASNYAIYTNAGQLRFGDLAGTGMRNVTVDANGVLSAGDTAAEPWYNVATQQPATANTQDIYQMGRVAIGTQIPFSTYTTGTQSVVNVGLTVKDGAVTYGENNWPGWSSIHYGSYGASVLAGYHARGTNLSPSFPLKGDGLLYMVGTDAITGLTDSMGVGGASVFITADEDFTADSKASNFNILTTQKGQKQALFRVTVKSDGNMGIGTTEPTEKLEVAGNIKATSLAGTGERMVVADANGVLKTQAAAAAANLYSANGSIPTNTNRTVTLQDDASKITFTRTGTNTTELIDVQGTLKTTALDLNSDARLKDKVTDIPNTTTTLSSLRPVSYYWNAAGKAKGGTDKLQYGFIAQEVEKVLPHLVSTDADGYKSVNYIQVIPVLTEALQHEKQRNDAQQQEIDALKQMVETLLKDKK